METYVAIITVIVPLEATDEDEAQAEAEEYAEGLAQPPNDPMLISDVQASVMTAHLRKFFSMTALQYYLIHYGVPAQDVERRLRARRALTLAEIESCRATEDGAFTYAI